MGAFEVTHGQFQHFVREMKGRQPPFKTDAEKAGQAYTMVRGTWGPTKDARWDKVGFNQDGQHPVVCVSWNDALAFCQWASAKTGRKVRLPAEAEWEYACRAWSTTAFFCGDNAAALGDSAWYEANGERTTHPVGRKGDKGANAWKLFDMHGNVMEWCEDAYGLYPPGPGSDPRPDKGKGHVVRGGAWDKPAAACRSAARAWYPDVHCAADLGFRVVVE
jgi:formylglycine-generating enzyme required for sulfatase activity